jgi:hypothetical protein
MPGEGRKKKHEQPKKSVVSSAGAAVRRARVPASRRDLPAARRKSDEGGGPDHENQADTLPPMIPWMCVHCGVMADGDTDTCWNCGAARGD